MSSAAVVISTLCVQTEVIPDKKKKKKKKSVIINKSITFHQT